MKVTSKNIKVFAWPCGEVTMKASFRRRCSAGIARSDKVHARTKLAVVRAAAVSNLLSQSVCVSGAASRVRGVVQLPLKPQAARTAC